jgi:foldase protein PrsA
MIPFRKEQETGMQFKKLAIVAVIGLTVALVLSGCGRGSFVTINGDKISKDEFERRLESWSLGSPPTTVGDIVLDQMIKEKLYLQMAKERGVEPSDAQIQKELDFAKREGTLGSTLQQRRITIEDVKKELRAQLAVVNIVTKGIKVTDDEVRKFYEQNKQNYPYTRQASTLIGVIVCNSREDIGKAQDQLKRGTDFSTVALRLSRDPVSGPYGGRLGWVAQGMTGVPKNVLQTAFRLKMNEISDPFEVKAVGQPPQWIILKVLDRKPKTVLAYDDVKDQIRRTIAISKGKSLMDFPALLAKERQKSKIYVRSDRYKGFEKTKPAEEAPAKREGKAPKR